MTRYASGRRKEWDCVKRLRAAGWLAQRSAGSRGLWDVVAVKRGQRVRLVQCKYTATGSPTRYPPASALDENARKLLALGANEATPADVELWVYARGVKNPFVYAEWLGAWVLNGGRVSTWA